MPGTADLGILRTVLGNLPSAVVIAEAPSGRPVFVNDRARELLGLRAEEGRAAAGVPWRLHRPDGRPYAPRQEPMARALGGEMVVAEVAQLRRSLGDWITLTVNGAPVRDAQGRVTHAVVVAVDLDRAAARRQAARRLQDALTAVRQQSEAALRDSEERYRTLFTHMSEGFAVGETVLDPAGTPQDIRLRDMNDAFERHTGLGRQALGRPLSQVVPELEWHWVEAYCGVAQGGQPAMFTTHNRQSGRHYRVHCYSPANGRFALLFHDVTEQQQAEEALRELTATLEARVAQRTEELERRTRQLQKLALELSQAEDRERRRIAEILHDDLQQQLAAAKFLVGLLGHRVTDPTTPRLIGTQVSRVLDEAIERSRSLSRELSPAALYRGSLTEAVQWAADQVRENLGLAVAVEASGRLEMQSDALKAFLYRAVQELLLNVAKHARVSQARVRLRRVGSHLCLSVSDHGRGFDPEEVRKATGFGLLSIRERTELLGGRMHIRSARGRGSTFFIAVPDEPPSPAPAASPSPGRAAPAGPRLRVRLVDDHEIVRQGLVSLCGEQGDIEVVGTAANGREAVDMAHQLRPDVVVMDVSMPVMSGDEATRQICHQLPQTRVVALSMHEETGMVGRMRRAGAQAYVLKNAPPDDLLAAIRQHS
ncbi:MAG: response regulator [Candidatus Latescibacterota bacterium]